MATSPGLSLNLATSTIPSFPDPSVSANSSPRVSAYIRALRTNVSSYMNTNQNFGAYSARVQMRLLVNGDSLGITHMGPDFLLVEPVIEHPPCDATVVLQVEKSERR